MNKDHKTCPLCDGLKDWNSLSLEKKGYITVQRKRRFKALKLKHTAAMGVGMTHKLWLSEKGSKTRVSHRSADGQKVNIDSPFTVGGEQLFLPSDPMASFEETANCRCDVKFIKVKKPSETPSKLAAVSHKCQLLRENYDATVSYEKRALSEWKRFYDKAKLAERDLAREMNASLASLFAQKLIGPLKSALKRNPAEFLMDLHGLITIVEEHNGELAIKIETTLLPIYNDLATTQRNYQQAQKDLIKINQSMLEYNCPAYYVSP